MKTGSTTRLSVIIVSIFFLFLGVAVWIENVNYEKYESDDFWYRIKYSLSTSVFYDFFPVLGYAGEEMWSGDESAVCKLFCYEMPLFDYLAERKSLVEGYGDEESAFGFVLQENGSKEDVQTDSELPVTQEFYDEMMNENHHAAIFTEDSDFFTGGSGFISEISTAWITEFVKATGKTVVYDESKLKDYEFVMENFYTVDACTSAGPDILNPAVLLSYDVTVDKSAPGPHILIYHTHSQEAFADSVQGDKSTTIVGAGAKLSELLREEYGYEVYHHTGEYDVDTRDDAYARSAPALEEILAQYPQIQVIIDLHRDGVAESRHLVAQWEGKTVAQFMFFNGLSYLNTKGSIEYLNNPNLTGNLALSFHATVAANEYYPGLARRTYLNGYRYNMHYRDKTMLIELGAQTNTVDEIMSACEPLAHILDIVFSGEENG